MKLRRELGFLFAALAFAAGHAPARAQTDDAPAEETEAKAWSFSLSACTYFVPDDTNYAQPTVTADYDQLHFEARYNYEDLHTVSVWAGWNFSFGQEITLDLTPMLGGVFGDASGVAPGYKGTLAWWKLELYSEGEYLFDTSDSSDSFFYNWSELALAPVDWFRFGVVGQRTRAYDGDFDVQRGFLVGFSYERLDVTGYLFNPDEDDPTVVLGVVLSF